MSGKADTHSAHSGALEKNRRRSRSAWLNTITDDLPSFDMKLVEERYNLEQSSWRLLHCVKLLTAT